jgi:arylsulfatase A-like enzyme
LYLALAVLLALGALLSQLELRLPLRPKGTVAEDLLALRQRDDVNVLFILIDTLRADHLGAYGYERATSPVMDELARVGIRFAHVESQSSWTKTSMASLWTGHHPARTGVHRFPHALPPAATLPAERFREAGFHTGGIFRNGWVAENFGFAQGFDLYVRPTPNMRPARFQRRNPSVHPLAGTELDVTDSAIQFLRTHAADRFLLYLHYMDVHQYLYDEHSARFGARYVDAYDNAIHWTDRNVGALVSALQELDLFGKTFIVIAVDHGEAFGEHGTEGHARNLYREVTEVPLILSPPLILEPGIVVEERVQNVDIWPTVLDLLGMPPLPDTDGRSLVPLIQAAAGAAEPGAELLERPALAQLDRSWGRDRFEPRPLVSVVKGPYRLVMPADAPEEGELYDRSSDQDEQRNLAAERPEVLAELRGEIERYLARSLAWEETPEVDIDAMHLEQLRALGYVVQPGRQ